MSPPQTSARLNDEQWLASLRPDTPLTPETVGRAISWMKEYAGSSMLPTPFTNIFKILIGSVGQENKYTSKQVDQIRHLLFTLHTDGYCDAVFEREDLIDLQKEWVKGTSFAFWAPPREIVQVIKACDLDPGILKAWVNTPIVENGLTLILSAAHSSDIGLAEEDVICELVDMGANASVQMPAERSYYPGANLLHFVSQPRTIHTLMAAPNPPDINAQDDKGRTPIMCPVINDTWLRLAALLGYSPDLSLKDKRGRILSEIYTTSNGKTTSFVSVLKLAEILSPEELPGLGNSIERFLRDAAAPLAHKYFREEAVN